MRKLIFIILSILFILFIACSEEKEEEPARPDVYILEEDYSFKEGRYQSLYYNFVDDDVVCFYIDLTQYGKIILEMSKQLLGQRVAIENGSRFWLFSMGSGSIPFQSFKNTYTDFEGYTGWFTADLDKQTSKCSLEFELVKDGMPFAKGKVGGTFQKITPTQ